MSAQKAKNSKAEALASVPAAVTHISCDTLFERPVQAELTQLLLHDYEQGFKSCALAEAERALLLERERAWRAKVSHLWTQNCA